MSAITIHRLFMLHLSLWRHSSNSLQARTQRQSRPLGIVKDLLRPTLMKSQSGESLQYLLPTQFSRCRTCYLDR